MSQFGFFQAIYRSFFSSALYRDVARNWGASIFLYLLLILFLSWIAAMFMIQPVITLAVSKVASEVAPQFPNLVIDKGIVKTPENRPYLIKSRKDIIGIIDTSGQYTDIKGTPASFMLLKDKFLYLDKAGNVKSYNLSPSFSMNVNPIELKQKLIRAAGWLWVIIIPIGVFFSFFYRIIQSIFYAIIGKVFALMSNIPLTYEKVYKITIIAITPAIVIATILEMFHLKFPHEGLFYFILSMAYILFGVRSNKDVALPTNTNDVNLPTNIDGQNS